MIFLMLWKHSASICVDGESRTRPRKIPGDPGRDRAARALRAAEGATHEAIASQWAVAALVLVLLVGGVLRAVEARKAQQAAVAAAARRPRPWCSSRRPTWCAPTRRELAQTLAVSGTLKAVDSALVKARVAGELTGLTRARRRRRHGRPGDRAHRPDRIPVARAPGAGAGRLGRARRPRSRSAPTTTTRRWWTRASSRRPRSTPRSHNLNAAQARPTAPRWPAVEMARKSLDDTVLHEPDHRPGGAAPRAAGRARRASTRA